MTHAIDFVQPAPTKGRGVVTHDAPQPVALLDGPALAAPLPDVPYLVREMGLVAGGGAPHLLAGYGFSGKTVAVQSMALSLAAARVVWSAYACRDRRRVVHVDMEQGDRLTRRRYQRLALAMGVDLAKLGDSLAVAIMPRITLAATHADCWREMMRGRDLLIVDSLRAASPGGDENSSDIRSGLDLLGTLSEDTGCRALVIHHARKPSDDAPEGRYAIRGSSAIFDGVDSAYLFSAERDDPVHVQHVKARSHGELVEPFALVISDAPIGTEARAGLVVEVRAGELIVERRAQRAEAARTERARRDAEGVRRRIAANPGAGTAALRTSTGLSGDRFAAALEHLGDAVEVREEKRGKARATRGHYLRPGA
jgi:AAA domain-containing protein